MQPEALVQLAGSGNTRKVEEEWQQLLDNEELPARRLASYEVVLSELCRNDNASLAETLAWSAVESVSSRKGPGEALHVVGPFLQAVQSDELRKQAAATYRTAYEGREGLEGVIAESGLEGARPVRRALRILDLCLNVSEGDYLVGRDEDTAGRIDRVDPGPWEFEVAVAGEGTERLGAVELADRFRKASETDYRVQRHFAPEALADRLANDPASVVIEVLKLKNNRLHSDALELELVPNLIAENEWKKWWSKARTALKKSPNVLIEGRSPYELTYVDAPLSYDKMFAEEFARTAGLEQKVRAVDQYTRECRVRGEEPNNEVVAECATKLTDRAKRQHGTKNAAVGWSAALRVRALAGIRDFPDEAVRLFSQNDEAIRVLLAADDAAGVQLACECLIQGRAEDWTNRILALLPDLPQPVCDSMAIRLLEAGKDEADFEPLLQEILTNPTEHFEALLWLWDGPSSADRLPSVASVNLLTRILRALDESRRSDIVSRDTEKRFNARARNILSARRMERFQKCLAEIDSGMAVALRNQISRCDSLGRAVREDMIRALSERFPPAPAREAAIPPWKQADVIYVTQEGLNRKRAEIEQHVNVKMRDNARAIGAAAEHGDLSENSEYKFALEERDLLRARLAQMNDEVAKAKVLRVEDVPTDHVGVGSRVVFRGRSNGLDLELTFLGPWEASQEQGIFNYLAPLSQSIMGKKVGEVVNFDIDRATGEYELVAIQNALASEAHTG